MSSPAPRLAVSPRLRLALEGFSDFERQALESYFRLAAVRQPAFEPGAGLGDCAFCVVDADRPAAVAAVRAAQRQGVAVYVGKQAPQDAAAHLPRPIDPRRVARALDALARTTVSRPEATTPADAQVPVVPLARPAARLPARSTRPLRAASSASFDFDVLVVSDLDLTRRFLAVQLQRLGCRVHECGSAGEALDGLAARRFRVVFADMATAHAGLDLCQRIKHAQAGAPAVVLVGALASPSDRVRGLMSGCDEHLARPIVMDELVAVLRTHGNRRRRAR